MSSANACFTLEPNVARPNPQSRFQSKQSINGPKRIALAEKSHRNEIGYGQPQIRPQGRPPMQQQFQQFQQQQQFQQYRPSRNENHYDDIETMYPADPPQKFKGFTFTPSNEIDFDDEIELEPLAIRGETKWF